MNAKRFGIVFGATLAAIILGTTQAYASWSSSISGALTGFTSREWAEESYSEINFTRCSTEFSGAESVDVELIRVDGVNKSYGSKRFTACFTWGDGVETSTGVWNSLPAGDYVFRIKLINGDSSGNNLNVNSVFVDTTKAD
ncbi:hypothetical protein [Streptomyces sp. NPDC052179]|uniref:hypothetical protein n=1 Tax=Streptomyces sp. NPDC052179 TaxID=3155680 RepID=UPI00341E21A5